MTSTWNAPLEYIEEHRERHRRALASLMPSFDPADPSVTFNLWFHKSQIIGCFLGYGMADILPVMETKLRGEARTWYEALSEADRSQWEGKIAERFKTRWPAPKYIHMLATRKYREGENIMLYFADKAALLHELGIHGRVAVECTVIETGLLEVEIDVQRRKIVDMRNLLLYFGQLEFNRTFRRTATLTDETNILKNGTVAEKYKSLIQDNAKYLDWQYAKIHLAERLNEERRRWSNDETLEMNVPEPQHVPGYKIPEHINSRIKTNAKVVSLGVEPNFRHEGRFFDVVVNGGAKMQAYLDNTCGCIALRRREAVLLGLPYHLITNDDHTWLRHYAQDDHLRFGPGCERPLGLAWYQIKIDQVTIMAPVYIVRTEILHVPLLIGQPFTNNTNTTIIECGGYVRVCETNRLLTMNPAVTDRSLLMRIGSDGAQPKVMTAQTVQAQKTEEEDEAETCDLVSLVLELEHWEKEKQKDQERDEVVNNEEEEKKNEEEDEVMDKEEQAKETQKEDEVVNKEDNKEEEDEVSTEEEKEVGVWEGWEETWKDEEEAEEEEKAREEEEEAWEEVKEEVMEKKEEREEEGEEAKEEVMDKKEAKEEVMEKKEEREEEGEEERGEEEEKKVQEEEKKLQEEEEKIQEKEKKIQEEEKKVQEEEKEEKDPNEEKSDVDEKRKDVEIPETLKLSQMVETIDKPKQKRDNSPPSGNNEEDWDVVAENYFDYKETCVLS